MSGLAAWQIEALAHAREEFPREACGLVMADGRYIRCSNEAVGEDHFVLPRKEFEAADEQGEITAIFHSHPNASCNPSEADRVACEISGVPWFVVGLPSEQWGHCAPCGFKMPLIGRPFAHGVLDCYTLIRDWYREERGIELPDFERRHNWWRRHENLYVKNFEVAGFRAITLSEARIGDVLLMQIRSDEPNHGAIIVESSVILHHLHDRISCRQVYDHFYRDRTTHVLRHHQCEP